MRYFSMFSGIGGFELGIQRAYSRQQEPIRQGYGGKNIYRHRVSTDADSSRDKSNEKEGCGLCERLCIGYSEIDKYAIKVYERNFSGHRNYGNATAINATDLPDFDLLVGGFPCQAFSIAGKRAGFDDTRGTLFFDIARILKEKRPRHLVLENVKGLLSHDSGRTFTTIIGVLTDLGYLVEWQVLNSKDFGVPQNRERVYIVGHLGNECGPQVFPIRYSEREIDEVNVSERPRSSPRPIWSVSDSESTRREIQSRTFIRRLTPLECERLQGFPDNWTAGESDTQRYKMAGNAVTVNVVEAVMRGLMPCL